ncbi:hypothetical protein D9M73_108660 [compost metagenome]
MAAQSRKRGPICDDDEKAALAARLHQCSDWATTCRLDLGARIAHHAAQDGNQGAIRDSKTPPQHLLADLPLCHRYCTCRTRCRCRPAWRADRTQARSPRRDHHAHRGGRTVARHRGAGRSSYNRLGATPPTARVCSAWGVALCRMVGFRFRQVRLDDPAAQDQDAASALGAPLPSGASNHRIDRARRQAQSVSFPLTAIG